VRRPERPASGPKHRPDRCKPVARNRGHTLVRWRVRSQVEHSGRPPRHPRFAVSYKGHECQWNGPSWPYATSVTLTALANVLNNYEQTAVGKADYFQTLKIYTASHRLKRDDGRIVPWIDENLNPHTGDWIARTRLKVWKNGAWDPRKGGKERGKDYNHSTYCDLVITGLVGLRPRANDTVEVNPLVPDGTWDWFCLDNVLYHNHTLTILWDRTGEKYGRGKGLRVLADGAEIASAPELGRVTGRLSARPPTAKPRAAAKAATPSADTAGGRVEARLRLAPVHEGVGGRQKIPYVGVDRLRWPYLGLMTDFLAIPFTNFSRIVCISVVVVYNEVAEAAAQPRCTRGKTGETNPQLYV